MGPHDGISTLIRIITRACFVSLCQMKGLIQWLSSKESTCNAGVAGDVDSIPGSGRFPGGENGNPPQYSCLENSTDRGAWCYFPCGSDGKESACKAGEPGLIPRLGRSPGKGNGNPLQYSCLENSMGRGTRQATVHGVTASQT